MPFYPAMRLPLSGGPKRAALWSAARSPWLPSGRCLDWKIFTVFIPVSKCPSRPAAGREKQEDAGRRRRPSDWSLAGGTAGFAGAGVVPGSGFPGLLAQVVARDSSPEADRSCCMMTSHGAWLTPQRASGIRCAKAAASCPSELAGRKCGRANCAAVQMKLT